jgi:alpha-glucosidase
MLRTFALIAAATLPIAAGPATAKTPPPPVTLASPGGVLHVTVGVDEQGRPEYTVSRQGRAVIAPSRLGFLLVDRPKLERNFEVVAPRTRSVDETWEQPWGERRYVRNRHNELRVTLRETRPPERRLDVVFRAYDDGVGFRYEFPAEFGDVGIHDELTEFDVAQPATAWWIPAGEWNRYEYLYHRTPLAEVGRAHTPITLRLADGTHVSFHEAALVDYSAIWLQRVEERRLKATLSPSGEGAKVRRTAPFVTPWRTLTITDSAPALVNSDLILNLNEPNALGDVSWVQPGKYVGVWWELHLEKSTWASGPKHGATTANVRRYVDFAAEHGFRGVLVEGWNVGWDGDWFANGETFSFTQPYPDFDLEGLAAYAKKKGVRLVGHHETSGFAAHYEDQMAEAFDLYARLGVDQVKTGYVADAFGAKVRGEDGAIHFAYHDGQAMVRHHHRVITEAAKRRISINAHEPVKDTGLRRTYPNFLAREGARGMEYNAWGDPPNPPEHEANLVYTRMLSGPMDFTPGVLSLRGRDDQPIQSTLAKQLALYVVLYSPIQMAADLPENYAKFPGPFRFIVDVPTDWAESRALAGEVGDLAVIARKDRRSDDWYLGAVGDEERREVSVPLDFLDADRAYRAQVYRDGPGADWRTAPFEIVIEERRVRRGDTLTLALAPGGGQAIRFVPVGRPRG